MPRHGRSAKPKTQVEKNLQRDIKDSSKTFERFEQPKILIKRKSLRNPTLVGEQWTKASGLSLGTKFKRINPSTQPISIPNTSRNRHSPNLLSLNPIGLPNGVGSNIALYDYHPEYRVEPSKPGKLRSPKRKPTAHHFDDELLSVLPGKTAVETWKRLDTDRDAPNPEEAIVEEYYRPLEIKEQIKELTKQTSKPPQPPPKESTQIPPEPQKILTPSKSSEKLEDTILPKQPSKKEILPPEAPKLIENLLSPPRLFRKSVAKSPPPPPPTPRRKSISKPPPQPPPTPCRSITSPPPSPPKPLKAVAKPPKELKKPPPVKQKATEEKPKPESKPLKLQSIKPPNKTKSSPKRKSDKEDKSQLKGILKKIPENDEKTIVVDNRPPWDIGPYTTWHSKKMSYVKHGEHYGPNGEPSHRKYIPPEHLYEYSACHANFPSSYPRCEGADLQGPSHHPYGRPYYPPSGNSFYSQYPTPNNVGHYSGGQHYRPRHQRDIDAEYNRHVSQRNPNILNTDMMSMMPIRTNAFPAPYVPTYEDKSSPDSESECEIGGGTQKKYNKEKKVGFQYGARSDCATEVSVTVEPRKQPMWKTMMNCGFRPVINCQAPPYVIQGNEDEHGPVASRRSCRVRERCTRSLYKYPRVPNYPYLYQMPNMFPPPLYPQNPAMYPVQIQNNNKKTEASQSSSSGSDYEDTEYEYEYETETAGTRKTKKGSEWSYFSEGDND